EVANAAMRRVRATRSLFYVDTLEHLWRGGRIGAAASLLGSALMIKPLLRITGGRIAPLEKVRTTSRALARLEELAVELAADREVDVAVQHVAASSRAAALAARLRERIPRLFELYVGEAGPVVGAHVGPGMLGVVVSRRQF
ncbi:DegV family protein, partial [Actinoallomurus acaciae]